MEKASPQASGADTSQPGPLPPKHQQPRPSQYSQLLYHLACLTKDGDLPEQVIATYAVYSHVQRVSATSHPLTPQYTIASPSCCKTSHEFLAQRFYLSTDTRTMHCYLPCIQLNCTLLGVESFLNPRGQVSDAA